MEVVTVPAIPKREGELQRPRSRRGKDEQSTKKGVSQHDKVRIPRADPDWHPIAKMFYNSLKKSGQADFYEQSDWALAYSIADDLSFYKKPFITTEGKEYHKRSGQMLATIYAAMDRLLVTEADRRRVRIELEAPEPEGEPARVVAITEYQRDLGVADD